MKGFRVYDKDACQYVTDELYWVIDCDGDLKSVENGGLISYPSCISESDTGLKDKHGKKIFEGDIVRVFEGERFEFHAAEVICCQDIGQFRYVDKLLFNITKEPLHIRADEFSYISLQQTKVIGNIHDNPELLEETGQ